MAVDALGLDWGGAGGGASRVDFPLVAAEVERFLDLARIVSGDALLELAGAIAVGIEGEVTAFSSAKLLINKIYTGSELFC